MAIRGIPVRFWHSTPGFARPFALVITLTLALTLALVDSHAQSGPSPVSPPTAAGTSSVVSTASPPSASSSVKMALGQGVRRIGSGELTWFGFRVYEAQLWGTADSDLNPTNKGGLASNFANQTFALELRYLRSLTGEAIADRSLKEIQKLEIGNTGQHQIWLTQMKALLPSVSRGDRITGVHFAGVGAAFYLNDQLLGRIDDPRFAHAFFAIWLDPKTSAPALRLALLNAKPS